MQNVNNCQGELLTTMKNKEFWLFLNAWNSQKPLMPVAMPRHRCNRMSVVSCLSIFALGVAIGVWFAFGQTICVLLSLFCIWFVYNCMFEYCKEQCAKRVIWFPQPPVANLKCRLLNAMSFNSFLIFEWSNKNLLTAIIACRNYSKGLNYSRWNISNMEDVHTLWLVLCVCPWFARGIGVCLGVAKRLILFPQPPVVNAKCK